MLIFLESEFWESGSLYLLLLINPPCVAAHWSHQSLPEQMPLLRSSLRSEVGTLCVVRDDATLAALTISSCATKREVGSMV